MITVQPILPHERRFCAYCRKPLQPAWGSRKTFWSNTLEAQGKTPEEQLAAYSTNRRIVRIARSYQKVYGDGPKPIDRKVWRIEIVFFPDSDEWGLWGTFCGTQCAARFGYASHHGGYRLPGHAKVVSS